MNTNTHVDIDSSGVSDLPVKSTEQISSFKEKFTNVENVLIYFYNKSKIVEHRAGFGM